MSRIELKNIQKKWGDVYGVRDVNIDIAGEEFLVCWAVRMRQDHDHG